MRGVSGERYGSASGFRGAACGKCVVRVRGVRGTMAAPGTRCAVLCASFSFVGAWPAPCGHSGSRWAARVGADAQRPIVRGRSGVRLRVYLTPESTLQTPKNRTHDSVAHRTSRDVDLRYLEAPTGTSMHGHNTRTRRLASAGSCAAMRARHLYGCVRTRVSGPGRGASAPVAVHPHDLACRAAWRLHLTAARRRQAAVEGGRLANDALRSCAPPSAARAHASPQLPTLARLP